METEELGSVYEALLELTPHVELEARSFFFAEGSETKGNARKTSGSYYTPDSLVQALLDSALDPVLDRVEAGADDPAQALLGVTVIDPACGSGHFLLAAARRIATRLARARASGVASAADYRHALRDVAHASIHGVDRNPLAVELCRTALWIETVEPGKPLVFLMPTSAAAIRLLAYLISKRCAKAFRMPPISRSPATRKRLQSISTSATRTKKKARARSILPGAASCPRRRLLRARRARCTLSRKTAWKKSPKSAAASRPRRPIRKAGLGASPPIFMSRLFLCQRPVACRRTATP